MTVQEIVENFLKENGYGGLCNPEGACGCELDDMMPCGDGSWDCEPAYRIKKDSKECNAWRRQLEDPDNNELCGDCYGRCMRMKKMPEQVEE